MEGCGWENRSYWTSHHWVSCGVGFCYLGTVGVSDSQITTLKYERERLADAFTPLSTQTRQVTPRSIRSLFLSSSGSASISDLCFWPRLVDSRRGDLGGGNWDPIAMSYAYLFKYIIIGDTGSFLSISASVTAKKTRRSVCFLVFYMKDASTHWVLLNACLDGKI